MKTTTWICDTCGEEITAPDHGWVEWLRKSQEGKRTERGLRLVHHFPHSPRGGSHGCQYDGVAEDGSSISDVSLPEMLGPGGLMDLLSMISEDRLPKDEVLEMIKRLHIPGYEHSRKHFDEAIDAGVFEPNTKPGFYKQSDLEATLFWAGTQAANPGGGGSR